MFFSEADSMQVEHQSDDMFNDLRFLSIITQVAFVSPVWAIFVQI